MFVSYVLEIAVRLATLLIIIIGIINRLRNKYRYYNNKKNVKIIILT